MPEIIEETPRFAMVERILAMIERILAAIAPPKEHKLTARAFADDAEAAVDFRVDTTAARTPWEGVLPEGSYVLHFPDSYDEFEYKSHEVR